MCVITQKSADICFYASGRKKKKTKNTFSQTRLSSILLPSPGLTELPPFAYCYLVIVPTLGFFFLFSVCFWSWQNLDMHVGRIGEQTVDMNPHHLCSFFPWLNCNDILIGRIKIYGSGKRVKVKLQSYLNYRDTRRSVVEAISNSKDLIAQTDSNENKIFCRQPINVVEKPVKRELRLDYN